MQLDFMVVCSRGLYVCTKVLLLLGEQRVYGAYQVSTIDLLRTGIPVWHVYYYHASLYSVDL